jgi:acetate:succinate coA transferase (ASCT)
MGTEKTCAWRLRVTCRYKFVNNNPSVLIRDVGFTNDPFVIAQMPKMVSVNSAIEIDITGQVVSDSIGPKIFSGFGGQVDFIYGASRSKGGKPIIAMPSTTKKGESKIVGFLRQGAGVVTTRAHVRYIVTEYGIADLYGKSLRERARAIIDIAHPDHRENLEKIAREQLSLRLYSVCNKHAIECRALVSLPRSANNTSSAGSFDGAMTGHRETTYTNASSS